MLENFPKRIIFSKEHFDTFLSSKFERNDKEILQGEKCSIEVIRIT